MPIGSLDRNGGGMEEGSAQAGEEWLTRALILDPVMPDPAVGCWADARSLGLVRLPVLLGWRRSGGPVVVGTSEGAADAHLLSATLGLAHATSTWTPAGWAEAFRSFWHGAELSLRDALATRLTLPESDSWSLGAWSEAVWGAYAEGESEVAVALVGSSLDAEVLSSIEWLWGRTGSVAGYSVEPLDEVGRRVRCSRVAGGLDAGSARPLPGDLGPPANERPTDPFESVERLALDSGATASWSRRDWVRFRGPVGTIRVFPHPDAVWLQLVGADEGTLTGLRFRHGVPLEGPGAPDAPPGAHLALRSGADVTANVEAVIREWLLGAGD